MSNPQPDKPGVYFTRARLMFVFQERQEYPRILDTLGQWSTPFSSTEEAREHAEKAGWVNRGRFVEKRRILTWRPVKD